MVLSAKSVYSDRYLYAFDFDHTIIDENSDTAVQSLVSGSIPEEVVRVYDGTNWTEYMNHVFKFLSSEGVTVDSILQHVRELKLTKGMDQLLHRIDLATKENPQSRVIIMSDANDVFINERLTALDPPVKIHHVVTNPAAISVEKELIQISPYENQTCCRICPKNLCKGAALKAYLSEHGPFTRIFYVGDGGNDLCPGHLLSEHDVLFAREGYRLAKIITEGKYKDVDVGIKAKTVVFKDATTVLESIDL